ncbi:ExbD/TolR family protein [Alteraurantiacibacter aquimixticola]|uniref:ExbD/TolR family protein n=1 Tax=Alteraurantiacibacter aquimixticola TaxID=2489173 RepID=A0A4T3EZ13_9SPHN|nr:ExbD/TolR family protein [Alteraurantiacibacter aquimixticola]TIX49781.1 ExbD/TolR family protein [Alteraurantiacibacter aquimixticola]
MAMGLTSSSRGRGRSKRRAPMAEINVTPFVDVMLVLLIIFMVTAPLLASGVPVELPESRANPLEQDPDQITISIDNAGFIYIDDAPVEPGGFPAALDALAASGGPRPPVVTLRADTTLDYGRVMAVMGELNRAGFNAISLVTSGSSEAP